MKKFIGICAGCNRHIFEGDKHTQAECNKIQEIDKKIEEHYKKVNNNLITK